MTTLNKAPLWLALNLVLISACGGSGGTETAAPPPVAGTPPPVVVPPVVPLPPVVNAPTFTNVAVHDPSVIKVGSEFYIFGSHLAAAKSADLQNWTQVADGVNTNNKLMPDAATEIKETFDWAQTSTLWAADVIEIGGKFYMYYNACKGDSPRSALGIAVADSVEGPYKNQQLLLKSGMWGEPSEDGTVYDATIHPNVVDPDVFFDKTGRLWMLYGSYSGGLFILELDKTTGIPLPDQGYGKHLMGGNHSRIEGGYVLYSPDSDYYYLFVSFGGLDANGGYNIRVARSSNPEGPYFDALGNSMADVKSNPALPLFDDASIAPYADKLMGNFLFERQSSDAGTGIGTGYVSPGHNSAYYDESSGEYFLLFHTRFPQQGEQHQVRVHQMFINKNGWPVVAPHRYAATTDKAVTAEQLVGSYKLIEHGKDISAQIKKPISINLLANGSISGDKAGSWVYGENQQISISLTEGGSFEGVVSRQWHETPAQWTVTFSALSVEGKSIWGSQN